MAEKVVMLALSPTMETGTIVKWNRQEGEEVATGDVLCEVETDKATMEYESMNDGILLKIVIPERGNAAVGQSIAVVGEKGENISALMEEISLEKQGAGTDAAALQVSEETAGGLPQAGKGAGGARKEEGGALTGVGGSSSVVDEAALSPAAVSEAPFTGRMSGPGASIESSRAKASPLAKKLADQYGVTLSRVQGSGPGGRIIKRDIDMARTASGAAQTEGVSDAVSRGKTAAVQASVAYAPGQAPSGLVPPGHTPSWDIPTGPVPSGQAPVVEEITVSGKRKVIAERLSQSKFSAPHYYLKAVIAVDGLMAARRELNKKRQGDKLTFNAFLVKFVAEALKRHPVVNSSWQGDKIVRFGRADIGIAVAQPDGLITPVLRDCWNRGIAGLDAELKSLVEKARNNKLKPEEYTGATFTISSLGTYGIHEFTAIINPPGSAILAVGQARREPVVDEGDEIQILTNMTVTLSCDHRVIDGATGALFLNNLKEMIENPVFALY